MTEINETGEVVFIAEVWYTLEKQAVLIESKCNDIFKSSIKNLTLNVIHEQTCANNEAAETSDAFHLLCLRCPIIYQNPPQGQ